MRVIGLSAARACLCGGSFVSCAGNLSWVFLTVGEEEALPAYSDVRIRSTGS